MADEDRRPRVAAADQIKSLGSGTSFKAKEASRMTEGRVTMIEYKRTDPGEKPAGDGWKCIHSGCSPNGQRWWLWERVR